MKVVSVKIENYKSFSEYNNRIDLENINTIIGKNESGKSNLIEAIGKIDFSGIRSPEYFKNTNKNSNKNPIISLTLIPYQTEKEIYTSKKETLIVFEEQYNIGIQGGISEIIANDEQFKNNREIINDIKKNISISDENKRKQLFNIIEMINRAEEKVFINYTYIDGVISFLENNVNYKKIATYLNDCIKYLKNIYSLFPKFILLDNIELKTKYSKKDLEDKSQSKQMLENLLKVIGMSIDDLIGYWNLYKDDDKYNFAEDINNKIEINIIHYHIH